MNLFLDIETIPDQREGARQRCIDAVKVPAQYKKPESIQKWLAENREAVGDEQWRKTALSGAAGEIVCIAWCVGESDASVHHRKLHDSERELLSEFYQELHTSFRNGTKPYVIGHNVLNFDLRFLLQRSIINSVAPIIRLPWNDRPFGQKHFDTMHQWAGMGNRISQDNLAKALGLRGKPGDIDGSKVWDFVQADEIERVAEYCLDDVLQVREIFRRMVTFV